MNPCPYQQRYRPKRHYILFKVVLRNILKSVSKILSHKTLILHSVNKRNIEAQVSNLHPQTGQSDVLAGFLSPSHNYLESASNQFKIISYYFFLFNYSNWGTI